MLKIKNLRIYFFGWVKKIHVTKSLFWLLGNWTTQEKERVWASLTRGKGWISARVHAGGVCWSCRCITHRKSRCAGEKKKKKKKKITAINNNSKDIVLELNCIYMLWKPQTLPIDCMQVSPSSSLVTWVSYSFRVGIRNPWWRRAINRVHDVYLSAPLKNRAEDHITFN